MNGGAIGTVTMLVGIAAAGALLHRAARTPAPCRVAWWLAAAGAAVGTMGEAAPPAVLPGILAAFAALGPLLLTGAAFVMACARTRGTDCTGAIDASAVAVGVVASALVLLPDAPALMGPSLLAALVTVAAVVTLLFAPGVRSPALWLLLAALIAVLARHGAVLLDTTGAVDVPEPAGRAVYVGVLALLAAAALHPSAATLTQTGTRRHGARRVRSLVPLGLALFLPPSTVLLEALSRGRLHIAVHAAVSMALGALVVVRTVVVTASRDAERKAHELSARRFRSLVENGSDVTCTVDGSGTLTYVSPAVERILGHDAAALTGRCWQDLVHPGEVHRVHDAFRRAQGVTGAIVRLELRVKQRAPGWRWCEVTITNRLHDAAVTALVCNIRDVSEHKHAQHELQRQARHDALTGLPNRTVLLERLGAALKRASKDSVAVAFLDLDRFKEVNDSLGHEIGDQLLTTVARRVVAAVRPGDLVARFGGDELVLVCEHLSSRADALTLVERATDAVRASIAVGAHELHVTPSVGIAFSAGFDDDPHGLIRDADAAMYLAKERGRSRIEVFDYTMRDQALRRLETGSGLHRAVERGEFRVLYQPIVHVHSGLMTAVEALVRWDHPDRGLLAPSEFIDLAEELGLTTAIGEQVLRVACRDLREWDRVGVGPPLGLSVNVSARQLRMPGFARSVERTLVQTDLEASRLCLEVTENVLLEHAEIVAGVLKQLDRLGVRLGIDDFGAGYTSLSYLKRFPVDVMKIDQSFVRGVCDDTDDAAIVAAVIDLAHTFGTWTVAEGVETTEQLERLADMACDYGQGFLFSEPAEASRIKQLLAGAGGSPAGRGAPSSMPPTPTTIAMNGRHGEAAMGALDAVSEGA